MVMRNSALRLLFIFNSIFVLAGSLLGPLYAVYVQRLSHDGVLTISTSWSVFLFSTTLFMFLISRVGDRAHKDDLLISGFLVRAFVWISYIFIHSITALILLQILLGLGEALGTPAFSAIFAEHLDKNAHIKEYADYQLISNILSASGVLFGGFVVSTYGFKPLFLLMAILAFISTLGILLRPKKINLA